MFCIIGIFDSLNNLAVEYKPLIEGIAALFLPIILGYIPLQQWITQKKSEEFKIYQEMHKKRLDVFYQVLEIYQIWNDNRDNPSKVDSYELIKELNNIQIKSEFIFRNTMTLKFISDYKTQIIIWLYQLTSPSEEELKNINQADQFLLSIGEAGVLSSKFPELMLNAKGC